MMSRRTHRAVLAGLSGTLALAAVAAVAAVAAGPVGPRAGTGHHRAALVALVGTGLDVCGDNTKVQEQGGTGSVTEKTCDNTGITFRGPQLGHLAVVIGGVVIG